MAAYLNKLNNFLTLLKDEAWHDITQLSQTLTIPTDKLTQLSKILNKCNIIEYNEITNQVKLNPNWKFLLFLENNAIENKTSIGTIILPPQKSVKIQCTTITNLTTTELEIEIRFEKNLKEIAIQKIK